MQAINYQFYSDEIRVLKEHRDSQQHVLKVLFIGLLILIRQIVIRVLASFQYKLRQTFLSRVDQLITWVEETNPAKVIKIIEYIKDPFKVACNVGC